MSAAIEVRVTVPNSGLYAEWTIDGTTFLFAPSQYGFEPACTRNGKATSGWFPPGYNADNIAQLTRQLGTHTYASSDYDRQAYMNSPLLPRNEEVEIACAMAEPGARGRTYFKAESRACHNNY